MKKCRECGEMAGNGPDPCLGGNLPGIAQACCGHGVLWQAYCCGWDDCFPGEGNYSENMANRNGFDYRGRRALEYMEELIERNI